MAEFSLPTDLNLQWASAGDILKPTDTKVQQGWAPEIPARQWFNWLDNRQDQAIAHIAQHGISVWSSTLEYQAGKSYVQGSDNLVYKAITTHTNINPVGGAPGNWQVAFPSFENVYSKTEVDNKTTIASTAEAQALTNSTKLLTPLRLSDAFKGANVNLVSSGYQKLPNGLIIQWGGTVSSPSGSSSATTFPITFPNACLQVVTSLASSANLNSSYTAGTSFSTSQLFIFHWNSIGLAGTYRFLAVGY